MEGINNLNIFPNLWNFKRFNSIVGCIFRKTRKYGMKWHKFLTSDSIKKCKYPKVTKNKNKGYNLYFSLSSTFIQNFFLMFLFKKI